MATEPNNSSLAEAIQEVTEKAQLLVREEVALAKAELTEKVSKLVKGAVVGVVAGIFAILGLLYILDALAWFFWKIIQGGGGDDFWLGFLIVAILLLVLGAVAGFLAARFVKKGSPPTPKMAIEEAQLIRQTISQSSSSTGTTAASGGLASSGSSSPAAQTASSGSTTPAGQDVGSRVAR